MFIEERISKPAYVEGRRFFDRTIKSKFNKGTVQITTTYMDGKPLTKQYIFEGESLIKNVWKQIQKRKITEQILDKKLNVIA